MKLREDPEWEVLVLVHANCVYLKKSMTEKQVAFVGNLDVEPMGEHCYRYIGAG